MPSLTSFSPSSPPPAPIHFVLIPFMSKGHIIPQIHLARLLSQRNLSVTIFNTPANCPFIRSSLLGTSLVNVKELPFPAEDTKGKMTPGPGVDNTKDVASFSMSQFASFATSTKSMQPEFERALLEAISPVNCIVYDWFLYWAQESAEKFGIPALTFSGISNFTDTLYYLAQTEKNSHCDLADDEPFSFPSFPSVKLIKNDFDKEAISLEHSENETVDPKPDDNPLMGFYSQILAAKFRSQGMLVNTFYELEPKFHDYWNAHCVPRAWCVGPLCLASQRQRVMMSPPDDQQAILRPWMEWLDQKLAGGGERVLYVSFGSQAYISPQQLGELARGLEESNECFLWVLKRSMAENLSADFEEKVKGRGLIVTEWVDQVEILQHGSIIGSLSHCGWNSVTELICAGKAILAMPMMAEQHLNARILVEEFGIALRMPTVNNGSDVRSTDVQAIVREFMTGNEGDRVRNKMKELSKTAQVAMKDGGSSWCTLNQLVEIVQHGNL